MTTALERKAGRVNRYIENGKKKLLPAPTKKAGKKVATKTKPKTLPNKKPSKPTKPVRKPKKGPGRSKKV
jgi:hypothetical protein